MIRVFLSDLWSACHRCNTTVSYFETVNPPITVTTGLDYHSHNIAMQRLLWAAYMKGNHFHVST